MKCSIETWNNKSNQLEIAGTKQTNKLRVDITIPPPPRRNDSSFSNREGREPQRGRVIVKKLVGSISWHRWSRSINQAKINQGNKDGASGRGKEWGEGRRRRKEGRRKVRRGYPLVGSAARPVQLTIKGESKSPDLRGWGERGQGKKGVTNRPISRDDEVLRLIRPSLKVPLRFHSRHTSACSRRLPESSQVFRTITLKNHSLD